MTKKKSLPAANYGHIHAQVIQRVRGLRAQGHRVEYSCLDTKGNSPGRATAEHNAALDIYDVTPVEAERLVPDHSGLLQGPLGHGRDLNVVRVYLNVHHE